MSAESLPPISYAPQVSTSRRWVRRLWLPALLLAVMVSAYWWGPPLWYRVQLAYWFNQCLTHEPPSGSAPASANNAATLSSPLAETYTPTAWKKLYDLMSPPGFKSSGTAFLGSRQTPSGRTVLVAVDLRVPDPWASSSERDRPSFHVRVVVGNGFLNGPKQIVDTLKTIKAPAPAKSGLRVGAGDLNDPTHFVIPFQDASGNPGHIDGWVRENGVDLELARPAVTQPLPVSPE